MQTLAEILSEPVFIGTATELTKEDLVEVPLEDLLGEFDANGVPIALKHAEEEIKNDSA